MHEKENKIVVSFCIATFQRYAILNELVSEILSVDSDKIEVVVCDDKSLDRSVEKIREIKDSRLKVYVNDENVGSLLNIHDSLDRGKGKYLFYVNDRDNVDCFKIGKLIEILEELEKEGVAFAKCTDEGCAEKYRIFQEGKETLVRFACRTDHPTGYILKKDVWEKIKRKRVLFENQSYGDYPINKVCAIMAKKYKGALIYGDICDVQRRRIDFTKIKSGYYIKRIDKRLWYTPEVRFRELQIGLKFLKKIGVQADIREQIFIDRYTLYLLWSVTGYKQAITDPANTSHYDFYPHQDFFHIFASSVWNGIILWNKSFPLCFRENRRLIPQISRALCREYKHYFKHVWKDDLHLGGRSAKKIEEKDWEISKREIILNNYGNWVEAFIKGKRISEWLVENGYRRVGIYGLGRIGKNLFKEFRDSEISIDFIMDRKIGRQTEYYEDVRCLGIESEIPCTDFIIVTVASGEINQIMDELRKKVSCPVKSISDILFVID